jgi:hypothetical protein
MVVRQHPAAQTGFVLPLSSLGALVLLLSSLSMQGLVLQAHRAQASQRARVQRDDQLTSAAQHWASELHGSMACLRQMPSSQWPQQVMAVECPPDLDLQAVQQLEVAGATVRLLSWQPQEIGGVLHLALSGSRVQRQFRLGRFGIEELG